MRIKIYLLMFGLIAITFFSCNSKSLDSSPSPEKLDKSKLITTLQQGNLKGNIESIILKRMLCYGPNSSIHDTEIYEYSEDGFIKKSPFHTYDEYGKISDEDKKDNFYYNDKGLLEYQLFGQDTTKYIYNDNNVLIEKHQFNTYDNKNSIDYYNYRDNGDINYIYRHVYEKNGDFITAFACLEYHYSEYDKKGNWIKRHFTRGNYIKSQNKVIQEEEAICEEREIKYRDENANTSNNKLDITSNNSNNNNSENSSNIIFWGEGQSVYTMQNGTKILNVQNLKGNITFGYNYNYWLTEKITVPQGKVWIVKKASAIQHYNNGTKITKSIYLYLIDSREKYDLLTERRNITLRENDVFILQTTKSGGEYSIRIEVEFEESNY